MKYITNFQKKESLPPAIFQLIMEKKSLKKKLIRWRREGASEPYQNFLKSQISCLKKIIVGRIQFHLDQNCVEEHTMSDSSSDVEIQFKQVESGAVANANE